MLACIPVTWKSGSETRCTSVSSAGFQTTLPSAVTITVRWLCMHPLGCPVVPEL